MLTLIQMSLAGSLIILAIVVVRTLIKYHLPKTTLLLLWTVALLRLLLPFSIPAPFSAYNVLNKIQQHITSSEIFSVPGTPSIQSVTLSQFEWQPDPPSYRTIIQAATDSPDLDRVQSFKLSLSSSQSDIWKIVWLLGFSILATGISFTHLRRRHDYLAALPLPEKDALVIHKSFSGLRNIKVCQSDKILSPMTYGLIKPVILLPKTLNSQNENRLNYILAHEIVHIRRRDVLIKAVLVFTLCLHWFNPLVWLMFYLFNRDLELSCDEIVVRKFGQQTRSDYAMTLISMLENKNRLLSLTHGFSRNAITERIKAVMRSREFTYNRSIISLLLVASIFLTLATSAVAGESVLIPVPEKTVFHGALGNIGEHYRDSVNSPENSDAVITCTDGTWRIENTLFTDLDVFVLLSFEGEYDRLPNINGEIVSLVKEQIAEQESKEVLYGLDGTISKLEPDVNDMKHYFLYSATLTRAENPVPESPQEEALILAAGDQWRYFTSLTQHEGASLRLRLNDDQNAELSVPIKNVRTQHVKITLDSELHGRNFYDTAVINPFLIQLHGTSTFSKDEIEDNFYWFEPDIEMYVEMDDGLKIFAGAWGEKKRDNGTLDTPGHRLGGGSAGGDPETGAFHLTQHFRFFELDMTRVTALIINDIRYPLN